MCIIWFLSVLIIYLQPYLRNVTAMLDEEVLGEAVLHEATFDEAMLHGVTLDDEAILDEEAMIDEEVLHDAMLDEVTV